MRRKYCIIAAVCMCIVLLAFGCGKRTDVGEDDRYIYCLNSERTGLIKVKYSFEGESPKEKAEGVLEELGKPASEIEYTTVLPEGVEIRESSLGGSIFEIDFNAQYLKLDKLEEKLVRAAIVQSLVQIRGVNAVSFSVEGETLKDKDGNVIGLLNEDDFAESTGASPSTYQTGELLLYFADESGQKLVQQSVDVRYSSNVAKEKLIVEKLIQGPKGEGGYPTVNPDSNLLSVTIRDEICYVNFDSTFLTGAYDILPELTVYSIVNSIVEGTDAKRVQITINGESNARYMGTVDLSQPLTPDMSRVSS